MCKNIHKSIQKGFFCFDRSLNIDKIKERLELVTQNLHEFSHIVGKQEKLIHVGRIGIVDDGRNSMILFL